MGRKTEKEMREIFDQLNHPDSPTRQLADWYGRDGADPPPVVKDLVATMRTVRLTDSGKKSAKRLFKD